MKKFPDRYFGQLSKSTSKKRAAHFRKGANKSDDDPSAYKPAPGDAQAKTRASKHTVAYKNKFKETKDASLDTKSKETGIPKSILAKVYDRGMAAWRTGHRPGTTPHQWALARVNSFATGGKTQKTTDKDLWDMYMKSKKELLQVKAEDLLTAKGLDAKAIAMSSLKNKETDLVSDPERETPDEAPEKALDKGVEVGIVHQESVSSELEDIFGVPPEKKGKSLVFRPYERVSPRDISDAKKLAAKHNMTAEITPSKMIFTKKESCVDLSEAKEYNDKAFMNKSEHGAFVHYMAIKDFVDPVSGRPAVEDVQILQMVKSLSDFKELKDMLAEMAVQSGLIKEDEYASRLLDSMEAAKSLSLDSPELMLWKTLTSRLQPVA